MNLSKYTVNCSMIFTELPLLERPGAAARAGFSSVEFWWPFPDANPERAQVDDFVRAIREAGVSLSGLNFFAGDMSAGDRGILSCSARESEFTENVAAVRDVAEQTGCRVFNALYGNRLVDEAPEAQDATALRRLAELATFTEQTGSVIVLEPLSAMETYPLKMASEAVDVMEKLRESGATTNVKLLADFYHLSVNGDDVSRVISTYATQIGHVQIADAPGRNEPGTGELPIQRWLDELDASGYTGLIGLEYRPSASSADSFGWLSAQS
jgi:hydroxypyruvate isomerase